MREKYAAHTSVVSVFKIFHIFVDNTMWHSPLHYFVDPLLRGPTIGCMLMCLVAALVGVVAFLRKQSLLGEALSHAAYPGVILGVIVSGFLALDEGQEDLIAFLVLSGAFISAFFGLWVIFYMEKKLHVHADSALCFVLSSFFGVGVTLASDVQFSYSSLYRQVQSYLYGQAATMTDRHVFMYGILAFIVIAAVCLFYKEIQITTFNRDFAKSLGVNAKTIDSLMFVLIVLAIVIGIRSVGVVLMSAMLVSPVVAARQHTQKLSTLFMLAAVFGIISGYLGNYFSVEMDHYFAETYPGSRLILPTGPMIVLVASAICLYSLCFSSQQGFLLRTWRRVQGQRQWVSENILKLIFRDGVNGEMTFSDIGRYQSVSRLYLSIILKRLIAQRLLTSTKKKTYALTSIGKQKAQKLIDMHRLWGIYLSEHLGEKSICQHIPLEEMEQLISFKPDT